MPEDLQSEPSASFGHAAATASASEQALVAGWRNGLVIINLRGSAEDAEFVASAARVLDVDLPREPCTSVGNDLLRVVWAGPDEWFVISSKGRADHTVDKFRTGLGNVHHAVTDVSSGYSVMQLLGVSARDVLAQGCPLDLHPRAFKPGTSARSNYFKTSVLIWQADDAPTYELLVRRSFMNYFWLMLERCSLECGLVTKRLA